MPLTFDTCATLWIPTGIFVARGITNWEVAAGESKPTNNSTADR